MAGRRGDSTQDHPDDDVSAREPQQAYLVWLYDPKNRVHHRFTSLIPEKVHIYGRGSPQSPSVEGLEDSSVSRIHFQIRTAGPDWVIEDRRSRNGTFLNGASLVPSQGALLQDGQVIRAGNCLAVFRLGEPPEITDSIGFLGPSRSAEHVRRACMTCGSERATLIVGASGTGRDRIADLLHQRAQSPNPMVRFNCRVDGSAILSFFQQHDQGHREVVYLDRIDTLASHFLEKVTSVAIEHPSIRVIASAQSDFLSKGSQATRWRAVGPVVELSPLWSRREDIPEIALSMARQSHPDWDGRFECSFLEGMSIYTYPDNLWTLQAEVRAAMEQIGPNDELVLRHASTEVKELRRMARASMPLYHAAHLEAVAGYKNQPSQEALHNALQLFHGNVRQAADYLNVNRRSLYRLMDRFEIDAASYRVPRLARSTSPLDSSVS